MIHVRQWSDHCFAVYVFDGDRFGTFVGTEESRVDAEWLGRRKLAERREQRTLDAATDIGSMLA